MNAPTDWISALAILAAGLILGALVVFYLKRRKPNASVEVPDADLKDLEAKRDALVAQLRDLDANASPNERTRLELETAEVLRQIDRHQPPPRAHASPSAPAPAMDPTVKGFLWGAASVAALAALGYFVMQSATPRQEGGSLTGDIGTGQQQARPADPVVQQLEAAVRSSPDDLRLRNDLAQAYIERNNLMGVFEQTKYVLDRSPDDPRALTLHGLVRLAMGEAETAQEMLERATRSDPKNLDSWVALAWVHVQNDKVAEAEQMIAEAAKHSPDEAPRLQQVFAQMKAHVAQMKTQPAQSGELPAGHPAVAGEPSAGNAVRVMLELDRAAQMKNGIVFVIARPLTGGPPVAAKRIQVSSFPVNVELTSADSMMGQPLPEAFQLEARLDSDGDAMTKLPSEPSAMQSNVSPGASVRLTLK